LTAWFEGVLERIVGDAAAFRARVQPRADGHGAWVTLDGDVVLKTDVQSLEVLADQHRVDILVPPTRQQCLRRTNVGEELEFLA
jgi:hypothetical protein